MYMIVSTSKEDAGPDPTMVSDSQKQGMKLNDTDFPPLVEE
jgi:hypothetical protein